MKLINAPRILSLVLKSLCLQIVSTFVTSIAMSSRLRAALTVVFWLVCTIQQLSSENVVVLIKCTTQKVNLKYSKPLPSARSKQRVTTTAIDSGKWAPCTVVGFPANVTYYLKMKLTQANCEEAVFTELVFYGFFNILPFPFLGIVNFTVNISDPYHTRRLYEPLVFNSTLSTPHPTDIRLPPPANITFTFRGNHKKGICPNISREKSNVDPYVYALDTQNIVPPPTGK